MLWPERGAYGGGSGVGLIVGQTDLFWAFRYTWFGLDRGIIDRKMLTISDLIPDLCSTNLTALID
jgi:hypothetical protein